MITEEQRIARKSGIYASDMARVMTGQGAQVWLEKTGRKEPEDISHIPAVQLGNLLERAVIDAFREQHRDNIVELTVSPQTCLHHEHNWFGAHPDALGRDRKSNRFVVETKVWDAHAQNMFGEPGSDEIPAYPLWQVQAQLAVTGFEYAYVPVMFTTHANLVRALTDARIEVLVYVVPRSQLLIDRLTTAAISLRTCITQDIVPDPINIGDARLLYRSGQDGAMECDDSIALTYNRLTIVRDDLARLEREKEVLTEEIQRAMQEHSELYYQGKLLATWRKAKDVEKLDVKALAQAQPDIYRQFLRVEDGSRRFLVK